MQWRPTGFALQQANGIWAPLKRTLGVEQELCRTPDKTIPLQQNLAFTKEDAMPWQWDHNPRSARPAVWPVHMQTHNKSMLNQNEAHWQSRAERKHDLGWLSADRMPSASQLSMPHLLSSSSCNPSGRRSLWHIEAEYHPCFENLHDWIRPR